MKKIVIKADINDADFVTQVSQITEKEIKTIESAISKLIPYRSTTRWDKGIPYRTGELAELRHKSCWKNYVTQNIITKKEAETLNAFLPSGDPNFTGIHTISKIEIVEDVKTIL